MSSGQSCRALRTQPDDPLPFPSPLVAPSTNSGASWNLEAESAERLRRRRNRPTATARLDSSWLGGAWGRDPTARGSRGKESYRFFFFPSNLRTRDESRGVARAAHHRRAGCQIADSSRRFARIIVTRRPTTSSPVTLGRRGRVQSVGLATSLASSGE